MKKTFSYAYGYGSGCVNFGGSYPSMNLKETAIEAKQKGFGFVQETSIVNNKRYITIYAWDVLILSYEEAIQMCKDSDGLIMCINAHYNAEKAKIFIIAPNPTDDSGVDIFPFDKINKIKIVDFESLLK